MRTHVLVSDADTLVAELGTTAGDIARIVPETRDKLGINPTLATDPDEDRYRLMQSVGDFLGKIGESKPLLVVLEDLHDADTATIDLLKFLSRRLEGTRVLVVGSYQDIEVDRSHPLSSAIAELRRTPSFMRVPLRGLTVEEVGRMIGSMSGQEVRSSLAEAVHRQTEGNPLFVQEVLRYFVEQGFVKREGDKWVGQWRSNSGELPEAAIPEGLRDVIGKRLSGLSEACNLTLAVAAVVGRDFTLDVLRRVVGLSADELAEPLDEARAAGIIEERATPGGNVAYRFAHAFFRQTLHDEMGPARRIRVHQQVGAAIEEVFTRRLDEHSAELAEHFSHSSSEEDLKKAVAYGVRAAEQAMAVYGYGEAVRLLDQAIDVQDILDPGDREMRCDLLLALGDATISIGDFDRVNDTIAIGAFLLAEAISDSVRASRACQLAFSGLADAQDFQAMRIWSDRASGYEGIEPALSARTRAMMAMVLRHEQRRGESRIARKEAVDYARESGDRDTFLATANTYLMLPTSPELERTKTALADEALSSPIEQISIRRRGFILWNAALEALAWGDRERAEGFQARLRDLAERTGHRVPQRCLARVEHTFAMVEGRFDDAILLEGEEMNHVLAGWGSSMGIAAKFHLGLTVDVLGGGGAVETSRFFREREEILAFAASGRIEEAKAKLMPLFDADRQLEPDAGLDTDEMVITLEAALLLREPSVVDHMASLLAAEPALITHRWSGPTCVARVLGGASLFLMRQEESGAYYQQALEVCNRIQFRPEIALVRLGQAELIASHYRSDLPEAVVHLGFVVAEFTEMGMQPALNRAVALQERLTSKPRPVPAYPDGLSAREVEVLSLVAAGRTDKEIADQLVIAVRTASNHVGNILNKTGCSNRAEAAAYAARNGIG